MPQLVLFTIAGLALMCGCGPDYYNGKLSYPVAATQAEIGPQLDRAIIRANCQQGTISVCNLRGFDNEWLIVDLLFVWPPDRVSINEMISGFSLRYNTLAIRPMEGLGFVIRRATGADVGIRTFDYDGGTSFPPIVRRSISSRLSEHLFAVETCPAGTVGGVFPVLVRCSEDVRCGELIEISISPTWRNDSWSKLDRSPVVLVIQPVAERNTGARD